MPVSKKMKQTYSKELCSACLQLKYTKFSSHPSCGRICSTCYTQNRRTGSLENRLTPSNLVSSIGNARPTACTRPNQFNSWQKMWNETAQKQALQVLLPGDVGLTRKKNQPESRSPKPVIGKEREMENLLLPVNGNVLLFHGKTIVGASFQNKYGLPEEKSGKLLAFLRLWKDTRGASLPKATESARLHPILVNPTNKYRPSVLQNNNFSLGGDSGSWVVNRKGEVVGMIFAGSEEDRVSYIQPMDLILARIKSVLKMDLEVLTSI